jgi:hypothetical protein
METNRNTNTNTNDININNDDDDNMNTRSYSRSSSSSGNGKNWNRNTNTTHTKSTAKNSTTDQPPKKNYKRPVLIGLGLLATTLLTFFGIRYWQKNKRKQTVNNDSPDFKAENPYQKTTDATSKKTTSTTSQAKKNTEQNKKDSTVKQAASAVKDFKNNLKDKAKTKLTPVFLATGLQMAYVKMDFLRTLQYLKHIHNVQHYSTVSKLFSALLIGRGRKTIVTAFLEIFKTDNQRQLLYAQFKRIGLKQKGDQWTLGDTAGASPLLITTQATKVWKDPKTSVPVPANMVLGHEVCKRGTFTLFENQRHYFLVESTTVKKH